MKKKQKEPWQIAAARYCVENSEKGFVEQNLKDYIQSHYSVSDSHVSQFIEEEIQFPRGSKFSRKARAGYWIPPLDLVSKVTDYDELKEARKNAGHAFWLSIIAIIISAVTLNVTIKQTNLTEIQSRSERIFQAKSIQDAIERCKESPELKESGLYYISNGKPASCSEVLQEYKKNDSTLEKVKMLFNSTQDASKQ